MTTLQVENYSGLSLAIFKAIGGKNAKTLSGQNASIFEKVNNAITSLNVQDLTGGVAFAAMHDIFAGIGKFLPKKMMRMLANIRDAIEDFTASITNNKKFKKEKFLKEINCYKGRVNNAESGYEVFGNGISEAWCMKTVREILESLLGNNMPEELKKCSSVSGLLEYGKKHGLYTRTAGMSKNAWENYILNNVKTGDMMIQKDTYIDRNGAKRKASHTGFVTEVGKDEKGVYYKTIEGNSSSKYKERIYRYGHTEGLSGFVKNPWIEE